MQSQKSTKIPKAESKLEQLIKVQLALGDVDLSSQGITDLQVNQLCTLLKLHVATGVQNLDLSGNKLTDNAMLNVVKAICETEVERLVISGNKLTEKCLDSLQVILLKSKHLKTVNMVGNAITSKIAKNKLINSLKDIDVVI